MKLAKLSLAAIMTVGAISAANAGSLEDAIKGVDFSGSMGFTTTTKDVNGVDGASSQDWDIAAQFVAPVADNLKATLGFGTDSSGASAAYDDTNFRKGVTDQSVSIKSAYFTYAKNALTVKAGHQGIPSPFTDHDGNGIVTMYNLGKVTLAGLYFTNSDIDSTGNDVLGVAAIGSFGVVNAQVWAAQVPGAVERILWTQIDGKVAGLSLIGQYINTKLDVPNVTTGSFYAFKVSYAINNFGLSATYTHNDDEQSIHGLGADGATSTIATGNRMVADNDGFNYGGSTYGIAGTASFGKIGVLVGYGVGENTAAVVNGKNDVKEMYAKVSYAYSPNFSTYVQYSDMNNDTDAKDQKHVRFNAKYSF